MVEKEPNKEPKKIIPSYHKKSHHKKNIPSHHSPVNHIMDGAYGKEYRGLENLEEARMTSDGVVILEGDYGGIIFVTCPVKYLGASHQELVDLCKELENNFWGSFGDGACFGDGVFYVRKASGEGVWGGMGGGKVIDGIWIHPKLDNKLAEKINGKLKYNKVE